MLAWQVVCNSIVVYSNYGRCRSVGMETTVARRYERDLAMRMRFCDAIELRDAIELGSGDVNFLQACPRS